MAPTIKNLVNEEVEVYISSSAGATTRQKGVLVSEDDRGILLSVGAKDGEDTFSAFVPWSSVTWVRAMGEHKPKPQRTRVTNKPRGF